MYIIKFRFSKDRAFVGADFIISRADGFLIHDLSCSDFDFSGKYHTETVNIIHSAGSFFLLLQIPVQIQLSIITKETYFKFSRRLTGGLVEGRPGRRVPFLPLLPASIYNGWLPPPVPPAPGGFSVVPSRNISVLRAKFSRPAVLESKVCFPPFSLHIRLLMVNLYTDIFSLFPESGNLLNRG